MRETKRKCKRCQCDDDNKKPGEYWVTDELCSACITEHEMRKEDILEGVNIERPEDRR